MQTSAEDNGQVFNHMQTGNHSQSEDISIDVIVFLHWLCFATIELYSRLLDF